MGDLIITVTYDGTLDSLRLMVANLKLKFMDYCFDCEDGKVFVFRRGILYKPGDVYIYRPEKKCECWPIRGNNDE